MMRGLAGALVVALVVVACPRSDFFESSLSWCIRLAEPVLGRPWYVYVPAASGADILGRDDGAERVAPELCEQRP